MNLKPQSLSFALAVLFLAGCSQAPSANDMAKDSAADMDMPATEHAKMTEQTPPATAEAGPSAKTASATGTVESVDTATGKITIAHGPVPALDWPAMTMAFKATPEQIASVKAGQKVQFEFESKGMEGSLIRITPME